jgi:Transglycosylase SLT domain
MKRLLTLAWLAAIAMLPLPERAMAQRTQYNVLVATHAKANGVPEALVHRVIVRESKYQPDLVGRGGTIGLMQIKLGTARSLGYTGDAEGLRDPNTNLTYAVKYLAGAYRAANGDHDRAVHYYAAGYYQVAKQQRLERERMKAAGPVLASAPAKDVAPPEQAANPEQIAKPEQTAKSEETAQPEQVAMPEQSAAPNESPAAPKRNVLPKVADAKPKKGTHKKLAEAKEPVPRPPASIPAGAHPAMPR